MKKIILLFSILFLFTSCDWKWELKSQDQRKILMEDDNKNKNINWSLKECYELKITDDISYISNYCINENMIYYKSCSLWIDWDAWKIFCKENKVDTDIITFNVIDNIYWYNKNNLFKYWKKQNINIKNYNKFIYLWNWYFKDDIYLYTDWFSLECNWEDILIYWELFAIWNKLYFRNIKWNDNKAFLIDNINWEWFNLVWKWLWYDKNNFLYTIRFNDSYYPAYISYIKGNFTNVDSTISKNIFKYEYWYIVCSNYWIRWCVWVDKNQYNFREVSNILEDLKNWSITTNHRVYLDFLSSITEKYKNQIINVVDNWKLINDN